MGQWIVLPLAEASAYFLSRTDTAKLIVTYRILFFLFIQRKYSNLSHFRLQASRRLSLRRCIPPAPRRPAPPPYRSLTPTKYLVVGCIGLGLACQRCLHFPCRAFLLSKASSPTNHLSSYHRVVVISFSYLSSFKNFVVTCHAERSDLLPQIFRA